MAVRAMSSSGWTPKTNMQASSLVARHRAWCNLGNVTLNHWSGRVAIRIGGANDEGSPVQSIADFRGARGNTA